MQAPRLLKTLAARQVIRRYHGDSLPPTTYNDLPMPQGSWKTQYEANQRKYNGHLALGVAVLTGTIIFGRAAGLIELNWTIPETPAQIDSYKE